MTPRIQKAIDIFLDAINEGHLAKGTCAACAVGNLCANAINYKPSLSSHWHPNGYWRYLFLTNDGVQAKDPFSSRLDRKKGMELIKATDFSKKELMKIEFAFETNTKIHFLSYIRHTKEEVRADQIRGLNAVVKVMLGFDNQQDDVNEVFTKRAELIPV